VREVLDLLFRMQQSLNVRLLLIGGWALQAHGYARNTVDVDCMVSTSDDNRVGDHLERVGFECFDEMSAFRRFRHRMDPFLVVDVMRVSDSTFEKMWAEASSFKLSNVELKVPGLAHLVALKLHAAQNDHRKEKDLQDIRELLAANAGALNSGELEALCTRFGTAGVFESIKAWL
jgi:hypothetical protein